MKKYFTIMMIAVAGLIFVAGCDSGDNEMAESTPAQEQNTVSTTDGATLTNTICPVMGTAVDKNFFIEYEGKKVYFCCDGCDEMFLKEPEKYLAKLPQFGGSEE